MGIRTLCLLAMVAVVAACGDGPPQAHKDGWNIQVVNEHGSVTVRAVKGQDKVVVNTVFSGPDEPARRSDLRVAQSQYEQETQVLIDAPNGDAPDIHVDVELLVPEDTWFQVRALNGDITLDGVTGGGEAQSEKGTIRASNVGGALSLQSQRGDLILSAIIDEQLLQAQTDDGHIELTLSKDTNAAFSALTRDGSLTLDGMKLDGLSTSRFASGQFGGTGGRVLLQTNGGNITVKGQ